jgi:hypothetical protein
MFNIRIANVLFSSMMSQEIEPLLAQDWWPASDHTRLKFQIQHQNRSIKDILGLELSLQQSQDCR